MNPFQKSIYGKISVCFYREVIPVAEESGIKMAIHPDDPPWGLFGLPRIITNEANLERFLKIVDSPANGLTFLHRLLGSICRQ